MIFKDSNGTEINNNDVIMYEDQTYMVMYIEKEDRWIAHPSGSNPSTLDYDLSDMAEECTIVEELPNPEEE